MDDARRRHLLNSSSLGKVVVREQDKATEGAYERAKHDAYERHPQAHERRQHLLGSSPLGKAVLDHEKQLRQQHDPVTGRFLPRS